MNKKKLYLFVQNNRSAQWREKYTKQWERVLMILGSIIILYSVAKDEDSMLSLLIGICCMIAVIYFYIQFCRYHLYWYHKLDILKRYELETQQNIDEAEISLVEKMFAIEGVKHASSNEEFIKTLMKLKKITSSNKFLDSKNDIYAKLHLDILKEKENVSKFKKDLQELKEIIDEF